VGIDQKLGAALPLDLPFRDDQGRDVRLGDCFGGKPVVLALVYYECPMLCTLVLNGLVSGLDVVSLTAGSDFDVVAVSIDPDETPGLAAAKKREYVARYGRAGSDRGWHFLTGSEAAIRDLAAAAGFRYRYDAATGQYAHAAGIMVATPEGKLARYFYGVEYPPRDLRLGLVEASAGRIGTVVDQLLLFCYQYDPATGTYGAAAFGLLRAGGALTVLALGAYLAAMWRREVRRARAGTA
jgi:protein SCO1/2